MSFLRNIGMILVIGVMVIGMFVGRILIVTIFAAPMIYVASTIFNGDGAKFSPVLRCSPQRPYCNVFYFSKHPL